MRAYGISMQPTFEPGTWLWLSRLAYLRRPPARGDIVAVNLSGGQAVLVKRVVGLPGERIAIIEGVVVGRRRPARRACTSLERQPWNVAGAQLGPHEFYVIGDNRGMPAHLHDFGRAAQSRIAGRVFH